MECLHCGSEDSAVILIEAIPCQHCGGEVKIEYNVCKGCGLAWKTVDGKPLSDTTFFDVGLEEIFADDEIFKEFDMVLKKDSLNPPSNNMTDYIHRCLKCNTICFESAEHRWECPSCGFTWEVIKTDE